MFRDYIEDFKKDIDEKAREGAIEEISHSGEEESAIILGTIFKYAKERVRMYVGDFNGKISNNEYYLEQVTNFLEDGKRLDVIVKNLHSKNPSDVYNKISLYDSFSDNVNLIHADITLPKEDEEIHFTIGDDKLYRIELDIDNYFGVACFNDRDRAVNLSNIFDKAIEEQMTVG